MADHVVSFRPMKTTEKNISNDKSVLFVNDIGMQSGSQKHKFCFT